MGRYLARRLLQFIPVVVGTMFLLHYMTMLSIQFGGDPIRALFGDNPPPAQVIEAMRARFGLDNGCLEQKGNPCVGIFWDRMLQYLQFDFGINFRGREITDLVGERWPVTLRLTLIAIIFETIVGVILGVMAGLRKDKFVDNFVRFSTTLLIAFPTFVFGVIIQVLVALALGDWIKAQDYFPTWFKAMFTPVFLSDYPWLSLVIPGLVLGAFSLAAIARLTRTSLIENLRSDYVRTARAKGLAQRRVIGVHTLRNSLIPVVTYIGIDVGTLLGGALVTERIFNIPGVGGLVFQSVTQKDSTVVIAVVTMLTLVFLTANLIVDVFYAVLDPRIRYE
ncbi:MAG: ABC transporter permease subunit [Propionibacteriales bacterium]|nr:ABC transporter permease subunit [Propionibacteriales bacterium]